LLSKVLALVGGSWYAEKAVDYAIDLIKMYESALMTMYVVPEPRVSFSLFELVTRFFKEHGKALDEAKKARAAGIEAATVLLRRNPA